MAPHLLTFNYLFRLGLGLFNFQFHKRTWKYLTFSFLYFQTVLITKRSQDEMLGRRVRVCGRQLINMLQLVCRLNTRRKRSFEGNLFSSFLSFSISSFFLHMHFNFVFSFFLPSFFLFSFFLLVSQMRLSQREDDTT